MTLALPVEAQREVEAALERLRAERRAGRVTVDLHVVGGRVVSVTVAANGRSREQYPVREL